MKSVSHATSTLYSMTHVQQQLSEATLANVSSVPNELMPSPWTRDEIKVCHSYAYKLAWSKMYSLKSSKLSSTFHSAIVACSTAVSVQSSTVRTLHAMLDNNLTQEQTLYSALTRMRRDSVQLWFAAKIQLARSSAQASAIVRSTRSVPWLTDSKRIRCPSLVRLPTL
jgi:hypothetical protein